MGWYRIWGIVGAVMASLFNGNWLRWIFMGYVFITILDCYYRPGFMVASKQKQNHGQNSELIKGGIIGWVAALLGVGGSVMTVPLLRRRVVLWQRPRRLQIFSHCLCL